MDIVIVRKGDVIYPCKTEEQLALFLNAGYVKDAPKETKKKIKKED